MLRTDRIVAISLIGICLFLFTQTSAFIEEGSKAAISAAFFPRAIIILLIICCTYLIVKSKMKPVTFPAPKKIASTAGLIVGYAILIEPIGYFLVTPVFLFLLPLAMGYRKWGWLVLFAVGGTVFSYYVFYNILSVPLPLGILEDVGGFL